MGIGARMSIRLTSPVRLKAVVFTTGRACTLAPAVWELEEAQSFTVGHPYLSEGKGDYAIDIYELMPVPEM